MRERESTRRHDDALPSHAADRLLEAMLGEALADPSSKAMPPDVMQRVLARVGGQRAGSARIRGVAALWCLASALAAGVAVAAWMQGRPARAAPLSVPGLVTAGALALAGPAGTQELPTGAALARVPRVGDRWRARTDTELVVPPLPPLRLTAGSDAEVTSVTCRAHAGGTELLALALAMDAGTAEAEGGASARAGENLLWEMPRRHRDADARDDLRPQLAAAHARVAELERAAARVPVAVAGEASAPRDGERFVPPFAVPPSLQAAFRALDWPSAATTLLSLLDAVERVAAEIDELGDARALTLSEAQRHNAEAVRHGIAAQQAGIPGFGGNGALTHPLVAVHLAAAALHRANLPLSRTQVERLQTLAETCHDDEERRRAQWPHDDFLLAAALEEGAGRERLYAAIEAVLSPPQSAMLFRPALRGTTVDTFGPGVYWYGLANVGLVTDADEFVREAARVLGKRIGAGETLGPALLEVWRGAVVELPPDTFRRAAGPREARGLWPWALIRTQAAWQLTVLRRVAVEPGLGTSEQQSLRRMLEVFVTFWKT
jgi:hypothetical protein